MLRVGYLDDEYDVLKSAQRSLKKYDIELIPLEDIDDVSNVNELMNYIIDKKIECLMVDYDLMKLESKLYGTRVIREINAVLPDFTCFLLTNYIEQGINEKLVQKIFVQDKSIFAEEDDSEEFTAFISKIKNSIECFRKRLEFCIEEYNILLSKKKEKNISAEEEEKFIILYHILKGFQYVDELPAILLKNNTQDVLDNILDALNEFRESINNKGKHNV